MATLYSLRLRFRDTNDALVSFTINPAHTPVDVNHVTELMDLILSSNVFYTYTGGDIARKVDALLIATEVDEVELEAE